MKFERRCLVGVIYFWEFDNELALGIFYFPIPSKYNTRGRKQRFVRNYPRDFDTGGTLSVKLRLATKNYRIPTKNAANRTILQSRGKGLHGHNLQREHDTGGTPVLMPILINAIQCGKITMYILIRIKGGRDRYEKVGASFPSR